MAEVADRTPTRPFPRGMMLGKAGAEGWEACQGSSLVNVGGKWVLGCHGDPWEELQKILPAKEVHSRLPEQQDCGLLFPWRG